MTSRQKDQPALIISNLVKDFRRKRAVDDVSMEIYPGEVFGFLGPNGAGKSTTIRQVMDFINPTSGYVTLLGADNRAARVAKHDEVGYLAGDLAVHENMTGRALIKYLTRLGKQTDWDYVDELVQKFDADLARPLKTLSKGNRQKIGLIQAFAHRPKLLILDEPTSGLDPLMKQVFYDTVIEAAKRGAAVLVSSHDLAEVQKICDRAAFIRGGKIVAIEDINDAKNLTTHRYRVTFAKNPKLADCRALDSVESVEKSPGGYTFTVRGEVTEFVKFIAKYQPLSLTESELELEEIFMRYYERRN